MKHICTTMQSCYKTLSDVRMLSLKGHCVQRRCPHACTWWQRDSPLVTALPGENKMTESVQCSKSIDMGSMVGACHPCTRPVQNSSRHLLALRGHPHLLLRSPPWAGWATLQRGMSPTACPPTQLLLFSHNPWLDFKRLWVRLLAQVPRSSARSVTCLQCRPLHLNSSSHGPSQQLTDRHLQGTSPLILK